MALSKVVLARELVLSAEKFPNQQHSREAEHAE